MAMLSQGYWRDSRCEQSDSLWTLPPITAEVRDNGRAFARALKMKWDPKLEEGRPSAAAIR